MRRPLLATRGLIMLGDARLARQIPQAGRLLAQILLPETGSSRPRRSWEPRSRSPRVWGTPREIWMGRAALGKVLGSLGRDKDAEAQLDHAARTFEALAGKLTTASLRRSFVGADPVVDIFQTLGRWPPAA